MHRRAYANLRRFLLPALAGPLILLAAVSAAAGDPAGAFPAAGRPAEDDHPRVCVFRIVDLSDSRENERFQEIIRAQLEQEMERAGYTLVSASRWEQARDGLGLTDRDLTEGTRAIAAADAAGALLAVTGFYRVEKGRIVLELKTYDVVQRAFLTGVIRTGTPDLSIYSLVGSAVAQMLPGIRLLSAGPPPGDVRQVRQITLLSPDEDVEVYLAGEQFVGRVRQGALTLPYLPLAVGSTLRIEKRKAGYYPGREDLPLDEPRVEARLKPLARQTRWATELNWTSKQLTGLGLAQRWYPRPDTLFLAAENYLYVQHTLPAPGRAVLHDDLRFLVGGYPFSKVDARFRLGLSTGLGLVVTGFTLPGQPLFMDLYLSVINTWVEWNWRGGAVYLRSEGRYALGAGRNLLGRGMVGDGPILTLGVMRKW